MVVWLVLMWVWQMVDATVAKKEKPMVEMKVVHLVALMVLQMVYNLERCLDEDMVVKKAVMKAFR